MIEQRDEMICESRSGCTDDAAYEVYDRAVPDVRHRFCATHYLRAARRAAERNVDIATIQLG